LIGQAAANSGAFLLMSHTSGARTSITFSNCTESTCVSADGVTVSIEYFLLGAAKEFVQNFVLADIHK
jgi:hypothetical protein